MHQEQGDAYIGWHGGARIAESLSDARTISTRSWRWLWAVFTTSSSWAFLISDWRASQSL